MNAVLDIKDLSLSFPTWRGVVPALRDVSLTVGAGEIVGLVGESGSGKSVTAMSVLRLIPRAAVRIGGGSIVLLGRDVLGATEAELAALRGKLASMVFQEPMTALNPTMTIARQIVQVIRRHEPLSDTDAQGRAQKLLTEMQVQDAPRVLRSFPFELSGGLRQRVLIAMAFACNPRLLIADEPTTALDVTVQAQVLALLREQARERGTSVLFITHDLAVVAELCDRVYVMYAGRIVEHGPTAAVLRRPLHPYTAALLRSLPDQGQPRGMLAAIPGTAATAADSDSGCAFAPRCAYAHARCATLPPLIPIRSMVHPSGPTPSPNPLPQGEGEARLSAPPPLAGGGREDGGREAGFASVGMTSPYGDLAHAGACWLVAERRTPPPSTTDPVPPTAQAGAVLLQLADLRVRFPVGRTWRGTPRGFVHALNGVDLDVRRGETLGVVGESGCGKSTLGLAAMRLVRPTGGTVLFDGTDIWAAPSDALGKLRRRFQVVFQDPQASLDPRMTAGSAIAEPLRSIGLAPGKRAERALQLAAQVGLRADMLQRYPHEFSGGQRQRIAIARALALEPDLLVLDEPTSALDVSVQAQILNLLLDLQARLRLTYLFISHNVAAVRHIADRVAVMYLGQVVELGAAGDVLERPAHPYTRALLAAVPRLDNDEPVAPPVRDTELPSNRVLPTGCFFRARCLYATAGCERPQALAAFGAREVRCHRAAELRVSYQVTQ
jgi:peptide/nickel transport system ATP-binding protein